MKKVLIAAAAAGFSIAICAGSAWFYIYSRGLSETGSARVFAKVLGCVWPTSIIMMDADKLDVGTILLFLVSSLANAFVYGIVAFSIYFVLRKLVGTGGRSAGHAGPFSNRNSRGLPAFDDFRVEN